MKKTFVTVAAAVLLSGLTGCNTNNQEAQYPNNDEDFRQVGFHGGGQNGGNPDNADGNAQFFLNPGGQSPYPNMRENPQLRRENENSQQDYRQFGQGNDQPDTRQNNQQTERQNGETNNNADIGNIQQEVIRLTNVERRNNGLSELKADADLTEVAQEKSTDMSENNYFSHTSPTYGSPFDMMQQFGIEYRSAAENIASGQQSAEAVVQAWMDSPGHRKNILNENLTHIGVGFDSNGNYWTQMFIQK
ncbi:CAP domain-containing protein [Virgibacillus senegalensis]|uniref:CAP domain-containing protein n=1 Tax=Virgibacillus senegalensis TaxID=1499679 RepID=UPI000AC601C8|nr:CAP domain-containing protein [Virgibacillus senegalensis]